MQKVDLNKVLELLINEEREGAEKLLHDWFVGKSREIHESLMQEEDEVLESDRLQDIEDDKEEIESEEFFGDDDLSEEEDDDAVEADLEVDAGVDSDEAVDDLEGEMDADVADVDVGDEAEAEAEVEVEDKVEDLEAQLAELKAEFDKLMGAEDEDFGAEEVVGDEVADDDIGGEEEVEADDADEFHMESEEVDAEAIEEADEVEEEALEESEDDEFVDLDESFELETVKDPNLDGSKEVGDDGDKIAVNDTSPIPQKKGPDRVGGKPVEIKAKEHKGYEREAAPEVKKTPLLKNQVKNAKDDMKPVSKEGDKSAMLNKKDGFGSDSPKSPIGAGATDLRGNDMKRK